MTEPAEIELLELPAEFRGRPYASRFRAQRRAETALPYAALEAVDVSVAEQTLVDATAHYLAITGDGTGAAPDLRRWSDKAGRWAGSPYGELVAAALLTHLGTDSGRVRQYPLAV